MLFSSSTYNSENEEIKAPILEDKGISLYIKREDKIHDDVSGNKFRKLKYNFLEAKKLGVKKILTFGGAYSNHIAATAAAGQLENIPTVGIIRGDELSKDIDKTLSENETLRFATAQGMELQFISRAAYRNKNEESFIKKLRSTFGDIYVIPEGGTNELAIKGCMEILTEQDYEFDIICCAVGTGGTITGIINSSNNNQTILGFPALKGNFLNMEIKKMTSKKNWKLINDYHFGGYGKIHQDEINFINQFTKNHAIPLDPIYTGKMMYGIFDMIRKGMFSKNTRILAIHTGGLQGIKGMNKKLEKKKLPLIITTA